MFKKEEEKKEKQSKNKMGRIAQMRTDVLYPRLKSITQTETLASRLTVNIIPFPPLIPSPSIPPPPI